MSNKKSNGFNIFILAALEGAGGALGNSLFPSNYIMIGVFCGFFGLIGVLILNKIQKIDLDKAKERKDFICEVTYRICQIVFIGIGIMIAFLSCESTPIGKDYYIYLVVFNFIGITLGFGWAEVIHGILDDCNIINCHSKGLYTRSKYLLIPALVIMGLFIYFSPRFVANPNDVLIIPYIFGLLILTLFN